ncbi:Retrovirus-related Pol polyprotein from transposon RE2 [Sesamum angolense]|uniref:Retrovirus-related Pol polyprotein from transposon RE2 n=1 Tax=Sesamum angolense TaxID=2727404 RepID=A0AAE1XE84_9LAMI|nr:Retrovirus-related Pol polyprotein from transposon RE2 [Sesamum angolense]
MGLEETFDHVRHQLLVMDPIPSVNKAYSMVQSVERQKEVHMEITDTGEHTAMHVRAGTRKDISFRDTCFKIHGTPDWYKDLVEQKRKDVNGTGSSRNFAANTEDRKVQAHLNEDSKELLLKELIKLVRGTHPEPVQQVNFAQLDDFAGMNCTLTNLEDNVLSYWIVDTGATNHMCANPHILSNLVHTSPTTVHLPDGSVQVVTHTGTIQLYHDLVLSDVLLIPSFKYNLLSVSKLCNTAQINVVFQSTRCLLQDKESKKILVVGKLIDNLYVLDNSSFSPDSIQNSSQHLGTCLAAQISNSDLWHRRLGHPSLDVMFHETTYPFQSIPPENDPISLPLPIDDADPIPSSRVSNWSDFIALLVYVDDILLIGTLESSLHNVKQYLDGLFTIKDLGSAKYFLGLELARSSHGLLVTQHKYLQDILSDTSMLNAKVASTPFPSGLHLTHDEGALLQFPDRYRRLVGRLLYLGFTRSDLSFPVQQLSQYMQHPRTSHWDVALHVLRYLKGSCNLGLFFPSQNSLHLTAYSDAAWASCPNSRHSITGFCVFLGGSLLLWKTKKQATVSHSSAEAEYRSMAFTVCELMWISYLLHDFLVPVQRPIPFWCDNKAVLHITANPVFHECTKHLDIDCHLVRDQFKCGFIAPLSFAGLINLLTSSPRRCLSLFLLAYCPSWDYVPNFSSSLPLLEAC